jgi:reactive intermediate/imine deaminase
MSKITINAQDAPSAIGTYSQAVKVGNTVYLSGQIPIDPNSGELVTDIRQQIHQVFKNLQAVTKAANSSLEGIVKLNIYLIDMDNFALVNEIMAEYFTAPYPARAAVAVAALPKDSQVEMDGILVVS